MSERNLYDIDPEGLFESHTINEIGEINRKIKAEIEKKRLELRSLVRDKYKDVLAAADTIKTMQMTAHEFYKSVSEVNEKILNLKNAPPVQEKKPDVDIKTLNSYRSIAIQIKVAMFIPNQIWDCLDNHDYLTAAQLFLLLQHIHTGLQLNPDVNIKEEFPIIARLRFNINSFKNKILAGVKNKLEAAELTPKDASSCLGALMLLENRSSSDLLSMFISLRKNALTTLTETEVSTRSSVRAQVTAMVKCLISTVQLLQICFLGKDNNEGLIREQVSKIVSKNATPTILYVELEPTPLLRYLPEIIYKFRPSINNSNEALSTEHIKKQIDNWLVWTADSIKAGLIKNLELVTSIKALYTIREDALKIELPPDWDVICTNVGLPSTFSVWYSFFQNLISDRVEALVSKKIDDILSSLFTDIGSALKDAELGDQPECDLRHYVLNESKRDFTDGNKSKALLMKTLAYSPRVVGLCEKLDARHLELLQDMRLYLYGNEEEDPAVHRCKSEKHSDKQRLQIRLRNQCNSGMDKLINHLDSTALRESKSLSEILLCARFLNGITHLCPNLSKCCSNGDSSEDWQNIHAKLTQESLAFWQRWLEIIRKKHGDSIGGYLNDITLCDILYILPKWHSIEITEQTDEKVFNTQIRIPSQPSIALQSLISEILEDVNRVLPHTLPKSIHSQFIDDTVDEIFERYKTLSTEDSMNQTLALQFLMDVKFLTTFCVKRENKALLTKSQTICDNLRAKIDPFDLNVFYSYLQNNVKQCVLQSQSILGCLLPSPSQFAGLGVSDVMNTADKDPSVLSLSASSNTWFSLLPVTAPTKTSGQQSAPPLKVSPKATKPVTTPTSTPSSARTSTSFFGAMTTDWFS